MNIHPKDLKTMHINAQSLKPELGELGHFLAVNYIGIFSVNETWLCPQYYHTIAYFLEEVTVFTLTYLVCV